MLANNSYYWIARHSTAYTLNTSLMSIYARVSLQPRSREILNTYSRAAESESSHWIRMSIDVYQAQSLRKQVLFNPLLALIASILVATTAAVVVDLAHNEGGHGLNNSLVLPLLTLDSAAPMPTGTTYSAWSGRPTSLSFEADRPVCRREYGVGLNKESCLDAWRSIPANNQQRTYGRRSRGKFEVPLPQRFLSGEWGTPWLISIMECISNTCKLMDSAHSTLIIREIHVRIQK